MIYSDNESDDMKEGGGPESRVSETPVRKSENKGGAEVTPPQKAEGKQLGSAGNIVITSNSIEPVKKQTQSVPRRKRIPGQINDLNPPQTEEEILAERQRALNSSLAKAQAIYNKKQQVIITKKHLEDFERKMFERETFGKYTLIFPFNKKTDDLSHHLNQQTSSGKQMGSNNANCMRGIIAEIK